MTSAARALLLLLLPAAGLAACGDDASTNTSSTGPGGGTGGVGGVAGTTSAGAAGATTGGAAGATAGAAGAGPAVPACEGSQQPAGEATLCFGPDGKSDTVERHQFEGGDFQVDCPGLQREASAACPAAAPCGYGFCGTFGKPYGTPTLVGDRCCFPLVKCSGPNACGRPLLVAETPVVARLLVTSGWS